MIGDAYKNWFLKRNVVKRVVQNFDFEEIRVARLELPGFRMISMRNCLFCLQIALTRFAYRPILGFDGTSPTSAPLLASSFICAAKFFYTHTYIHTYTRFYIFCNLQFVWKVCGFSLFTLFIYLQVWLFVLFLIQFVSFVFHFDLFM